MITASWKKAKDIYILPGAFRWDDVGSWLALDRINPQDEMGNVISGNVITVETHNSIIQGGEKLMALVGGAGMIAVDTGDALLLCDKDSTGEMKRVLENLRARAAPNTSSPTYRAGSARSQVAPPPGGGHRAVASFETHSRVAAMSQIKPRRDLPAPVGAAGNANSVANKAQGAPATAGVWAVFGGSRRFFRTSRGIQWC